MYGQHGPVDHLLGVVHINSGTMKAAQRRHRDPSECAQVAEEMRIRLSSIPSEHPELVDRVGSAIASFAEMGRDGRHGVQEGRVEVPDLGCFCEWSFSTQRIKRPVLRLVRAPHLASGGRSMPQRDLDAVLNPAPMVMS